MPWPKGKPRPKVGDKASPSFTHEVEKGAPELPPAEHETVQPASALSPETLGNLANMLLDNPAFQDACRRAVSELLKQWEATELTATAEREALYHQVKVFRLMTASLGRIRQEGKVTSLRAERMKQVA